MRSRRHHYTSLTNDSTSLWMQGEHNRTEPLPGLLPLTPTHATLWRCEKMTQALAAYL